MSVFMMASTLSISQKESELGRLLPYMSLDQGKLPESKRKTPGQTHLLSQPNNSYWQPLR